MLEEKRQESESNFDKCLKQIIWQVKSKDPPKTDILAQKKTNKMLIFSWVRVMASHS